MGAGASLTTALPVEAAVAAPAAAGSQDGDSDLDISRERVAMDLHTAKKAEVIEPPRMKLPVNAFAFWRLQWVICRMVVMMLFSREPQRRMQHRLAPGAAASSSCAAAV